MKKFFSLVLLLVLSFSLAGCSESSSLENIKKHKEIIVATNAEFPPFEYIENNEFVGFDMDLARVITRELSQKLGIKISLKIVNMDFDAVIAAVSTNKADIAIAGLTVSEKRLKSVSFSKPYFNASQVVLVKEDSPLANLIELEDILTGLEGKNIGYQNGTIAKEFIEGSVDEGFDGINEAIGKGYQNGALAIKELENGRIDAVMIDQLPAKVLSEKVSGIKILPTILTNEEYAIAIGKKDNDLKELIDEILTEITLSGEFDELANKYFGE